MKKIAAIILGAGNGTRMNCDIPKQFMEINGYPVLYYSLREFYEILEITEIVVVTGKDYIDFVEAEIINQYGFNSKTQVIAGGKERYNSVYNALNEIKGAELVLIHDGARPCIKADKIMEVINATEKFGCAVLGKIATDTIKEVGENHKINRTIPRENIYLAQTPQGFYYNDILKAHKLREINNDTGVTDDEMLVKKYCDISGAVVEGDEKNIKITRKIDLEIARLILGEKY